MRTADCKKFVGKPHRGFPTKENADAIASAFYGAGDEARTRYLHLGKVALYQMSYTREGHGLL